MGVPKGNNASIWQCNACDIIDDWNDCQSNNILGTRNISEGNESRTLEF